MRRFGSVLAVAAVCISVTAGPAFACGGLIGPRGSVNLLRTTTMAGYAGGLEHYVTAFQFAGGGGTFGSLVPLPGIPTKVERGGNWTLQRLVRETQPQPEFAADGVKAQATAARSAQVILETKVDALDITILKGGGDEVGVWAKQNGFNLPPDAPEVLDFYASRSPIFMAARFDADEAARRGQAVGDGTPIHLTIPTESPWVPLRILALGKSDAEIVQADVYLLTDSRPRLLPAQSKGLVVERSEPASQSLVSDLRADKGMDWIPTDEMWLSYLKIDSTAGSLRYDLAVSVDGTAPSRVAAGLGPIRAIAAGPQWMSAWLGVVLMVMVGAALLYAGGNARVQVHPR